MQHQSYAMYGSDYWLKTILLGAAIRIIDFQLGTRDYFDTKELG